jgi:hypothetical protein
VILVVQFVYASLELDVLCNPHRDGASARKMIFKARENLLGHPNGTSQQRMRLPILRGA